MDSDKKTDRTTTLRFIRDTASDEDFFGSHQKVGAAIAEVIQQNQDLKVIGLLGRWGSGKSTVIRQVQKHLVQSEGVTRTYLFCYDAWLYQSDPPRRSFLETLITFLIKEKLTSSAKWQEKIDLLNRNVEESETTTTPTLTLPGKLALVSLLAVPVGMQFISHDYLKDAVGKTASTLEIALFFGGIAGILFPIVAAFVVWVWWRPSFNIFTKKFWLDNRKGFEGQSILSLFINKAVERQRHRLTRNPEPTAIEFQKIFREIIEEISGIRCRLLLVIDNLDRLHEAEAVAMWGTIRSFFLGSNQRETYENLPVVILPIDEDALVRMYSNNSDEAARLAQSFMDKTFDLTFHVNPPVVSDWKDYFADRMKLVFSDEATDHRIFYATRIFEKFCVGNNPVTPRSINVAVNSIGTIWLQRKNEIDFISIAYYALAREAISPSILQFVQDFRHDISNVDENWQRSIAAIHFGVPVDKALQVLLQHRLDEAIAKNNSEAFAELASIKGFETVFLNTIENNNLTTNIALSMNAAFLLASSSTSTAAPWKAQAWQTLRVQFTNTPWGKVEPKFLEAVQTLAEGGGTTRLTTFIGKVANKLGELPSDAFADSIQITTFAALSNLLVSYQIENGYAPLDIPINWDAKAFLSIATRTNKSQEVLKALKPRASTADILAELNKNMSDNASSAEFESRLRVLLTQNPKINCSTLISNAINIVNSKSGGEASTQAAIFCLGFLANNKDSNKFLSEHADLLAQRLQEMHDASEIALARCTAICVAYSKSVKLDAGWGNILLKYPNFPIALQNALTEFFDDIQTDNLEYEAQRVSDFLPIAQFIISSRVLQENLGSLRVERVINYLPGYLSCVRPELHASFIVEFSNYDDFWEEVGKAPLMPNAIKILTILVTQDGLDEGKRSQANLALWNRLSKLEDSDWENAIRQGNDIYLAATTLRETSSPFKPLPGVIASVLGRISPEFSDNVDGPLLTRWFEAAKLVTKNAQKTLLKNLRDQILTGSPSNAADVIDIGGADFLALADFAEASDSAVRHLVLKILEIPNKRSWIYANKGTINQWVQQSDDETRGFLLEMLANLLNAIDDGEKLALDDIFKTFGIKQPASSIPPTVSKADFKSDPDTTT